MATATVDVLFECPKRRHQTRAGALVQARRMWRQGIRPLGGFRIYPCPYCGCWHIGNKIRRKNRDRR